MNIRVVCVFASSSCIGTEPVADVAENVESRKCDFRPVEGGAVHPVAGASGVRRASILVKLPTVPSAAGFWDPESPVLYYYLIHASVVVVAVRLPCPSLPYVQVRNH